MTAAPGMCESKSRLLPQQGSAMADVQIYSTPFCGYCHTAKKLLRLRGANFTEVDLEAEPSRRDEMLTRSGGSRTVPQIFIGGRHIGGYAELAALDRAGELKPLLEQAS